MQPCHNNSLGDTSVCASSCRPRFKGWHAEQIWHWGMTHFKLMYSEFYKLNRSEFITTVFFGSLQGSSCLDVVEAGCCSWCSWCQMHRELKYRRKPPTVINMLNQNITNVQMQPAPAMMLHGHPAQAAHPVVMTSYWELWPLFGLLGLLKEKWFKSCCSCFCIDSILISVYDKWLSVSLILSYSSKYMCVISVKYQNVYNYCLLSVQIILSKSLIQLDSLTF